MFTIVFVLACIGFALSLYGVMVRRNMQRDLTYKPACDISDRASCSQVFRSEYGSLFGIPYVFWGIIYYAALGLVALLDMSFFVSLFSLVGLCATVIFAYILYFKIRTVCVICTSVYVVNMLVFIVWWSGCCQ